MTTIDGDEIYHCQTCGGEGGHPDSVGHHAGCPDAPTDGDSDSDGNDDGNDDDGRGVPTRHEPADFGGGDTTGVQDL